MKRLDTHSQNFLRSPRLVHELIGHSSIKKSDTVIDIGAGSGVIASALASRAAQVIAYEYDARMIHKLRSNLGARENITIIEADFLAVQLPPSPYKVFANIPFHLSSPILKKLVASPYRPVAIYLIVQKQFAHKLLIDKPGFTGMLGAQITPFYIARIRKKLQRTDFWPHPAVDTVLLELKRRDDPLIAEEDYPAYRQFIANCFADPRAFHKTPLAKAGVAADKKPSELSSDEWVQLFALQKRS